MVKRIDPEKNIYNSMSKFFEALKLNNFISDLLVKLNLYIRVRKPKGSTVYLSDKYNGKLLIGAEIGVWEGKNALSILESLNIQKLYLIDPWENYREYVVNVRGKYEKEGKSFGGDKAYKVTLKRLRKYNDKIKILRMRSEDAVKFIKEELDFVYIDGNHSYDYVKKDLELYWDKVKKGGALTGDDFNIKDIARAVFEFSKEKNQDFLTYYVGGPIDVDFIFPKN